MYGLLIYFVGIVKTAKGARRPVIKPQRRLRFPIIPESVDLLTAVSLRRAYIVPPPHDPELASATLLMPLHLDQEHKRLDRRISGYID